MSNSLTAIVLAGGKGVRMASPHPKILHAAAGRTLIDHVLVELVGAGMTEIRVVIGFGAEIVASHLKNRPGIHTFVQTEQLGTADAVRSAEPKSLNGTVAICNGDH